MLMSSSKLFRFSNRAHLNSCVRLLLELYCVIVTKHVAFFTIRAKLLIAMAFPFTFPDVIVVSDLNKNIGGSTDLAKKRHGSADLPTPIHPLLPDPLEMGQKGRCWPNGENDRPLYDLHNQ